MSYGIKLTNNNNQIVISEDFAALHFAGKAGRATENVMVNAGISGYSSTGLNGVFIDTYVITINGTTHWDNQLSKIVVDAVPVSFIRPGVGYYSWSYAIVAQNYSSTAPGEWTIVVMSSSPTKVYGTVAFTRPQVYCFTPPAYAQIEDTGYGLVVKNANGITTFDSRGKPLAVVDSISGKHSAYVNNSGYYYYLDSIYYPWKYNTLDVDLATTSRYATYSTIAPNSVSTNNVMFCFTSVAQHVFRRRVDGYKKSCSFFSCQEHWSTALWWTLARGVVSVNGSVVKYGWGLYATGYAFSFRSESAFWGGGGDSYTTGSMPFQAKMINNGQNSSCIIADASLYD